MPQSSVTQRKSNVLFVKKNTFKTPIEKKTTHSKTLHNETNV